MKLASTWVRLASVGLTLSGSLVLATAAGGGYHLLKKYSLAAAPGSTGEYLTTLWLFPRSPRLLVARHSDPGH